MYICIKKWVIMEKIRTYLKDKKEKTGEMLNKKKERIKTV